MPSAETWPENARVLHLSHHAHRCTVLGPGVRAVLWVQGCPFRCPGCIAPQTQAFAGGTDMAVPALAAELVGIDGIEGITLSGGEPMSQASALCALIDRVRAVRDLGVMSYTGHTLERLRERGSEGQLGLLSRVDILIDGPYVVERHTDLRWRGSENQRVHFLSPRYRHIEHEMAEHGSDIEFDVADDGSLFWMGIPPRGFRESLPEALRGHGISLIEGDEGNEWFA